ncbi:hypothetical protein AAHN97_18875 [Chitinophaga niabensis]|uniref:hypothetical protein n=1 Tax=Chitinophaga niabensis TaxID=536979 RepID=UPI0031BA997F
MKRAALLLMLPLCLGLNVMAQTDSTANSTAGTDSTEAPSRKHRLRNLPYNKNIIKTNLSSIALNNYGLTYERMIARKISASLGYRFMPKTYLAKTALTEKVMDYFEEGDGEITQQLDKLQMSGNAITAEIRFYTGRRSGAKGFYGGVYGRYASFKYDYPYDFELPTEKRLVPLTGKSSGIGGGIILGGQFNLHKNVIVDLFVIGGHYGNLSGKVEGLTDLSDLDEQQRADLKDDVESLIEIGGKKNITAEVRDDGLRADVKMPFVGVRGLGLTIGVSF